MTLIINTSLFELENIEEPFYHQNGITELLIQIYMSNHKCQETHTRQNSYDNSLSILNSGITNDDSMENRHLLYTEFQD